MTRRDAWLGFLGAVLPYLFLAWWNLAPPMNDSGFYDQAGLNHLLHGEFRAPILEKTFPISGGEVFCAYPPLYPWLVRGWMGIFGGSSVGVIWLHVLLWTIQAGAFAWMAWRWRLPRAAWWTGAAMFWLVSFQGRPESLAHVFGLIPWLVAWEALRTGQHPGRLATVAGILGMTATFWTSPVAGLSHGFVLGFTWLMALWRHRIDVAGRMLVWAALLTVGLLVLLVQFKPHWWEGFLEHSHQTPSQTWLCGLEPSAWITTARHVPGVLGCLAVGALVLWCGRRFPADGPQGRIATVWLGLAAGSAVVLLLGFTVLIPTAYYLRNLQPLFVAVTLLLAGPLLLRRLAAGLLVLSIPGMARLAGLATWGVAAERDFGREASEAEVVRLLRDEPPANPIVLSSTFAYAMSRQPRPNIWSSDWLERRPTRWHQSPEALARIEPLQRIRPTLIIVSPFDYHRRFAPMLDALETTGVKTSRQQLGAVTPPDALAWSRKLLPAITWAPVVIRLDWPEKKLR